MAQETKKSAAEKRPLIPCPQCAGAGKIHLGDELFAALQMVQDLGGRATSTLVHGRLLGCHVGLTAINNRLEDLRALGLLQRQRVHRSWLYTLVKH